MQGVAALRYLHPGSILLPVFVMAGCAGLAEQVKLFKVAVKQPLLVVVRGLFQLECALDVGILLAGLLPVLIVVFPSQRTVKLVVHVLSVLLSFFVEAFHFQFPVCVECAVGTVQFAGFVGFLFRHPAFVVIFPEGSVLPTLLVGTLGFQLVVDVFFVIAIVKTVLETGKDIGGMVAVDNAVLSVKRLVARNFPVENTAVSQIYGCDTVYRVFFLCMER